ncbi:MAG: hypothetical protein ABW170_12665 [Candidatus Thiodiazotropha sp. L084R]
MPYIAPYRSQLRPYNHAYAYRGLTAFATLSMAVSGRKTVIGGLSGCNKHLRSRAGFSGTDHSAN